jgi:hypothetical protein
MWCSKDSSGRAAGMVCALPAAEPLTVGWDARRSESALGLRSARESTAPGAASGGAVRGQPGKPASCTHRLLRDWRDGRIDGTYPVACYRQAIESLPLDVRVYSSAEEDIRQALSERLALRALMTRG